MPIKLLLLPLFFISLLSSSAIVLSQDLEGVEEIYETEFNDSSLEKFEKRIQMRQPDFDLGQIPSLFFTPSEQSLIADARQGFTARPVTEQELRAAESGKVTIGPREITLAGIVYLSAGDWTIWLNGQKVTPKKLPPEILDIKVKKNSVKLKWYDAYTNQIFPVKLKTHQRFNIDTRIFLPG